MRKCIKICVFISAFVVFLSSCHHEEINEKTVTTEKLELVIERKSFKDFQRLPIIIHKALPQQFNSSRDGRLDPLYNFEIDSTKITHISKDGVAFYSMAITREGSANNTFENLIISDNGTDTRAYLVKYFPSTEYYDRIKTNVHAPFVGGINFQEINSNTISQRYALVQTCIKFTQVYCNYGGEEHLAGTNCTASYIYSSTRERCFRTLVYFPEPEYLVDFDYSGSNSGGLTPTVPEIITEPILLYDLRKFTNNLTFNQNASWNILSNATKQLFSKFLQKNQTQEGEEYAASLLNYLFLNNNSPEAIAEIETILDLLDDGKMNGEDVVLAPDLPITNMAEYLSIFNTSQPAEITIYADQPKNNSNALWTYSDGVGHAFISIRQGTKVVSLGLYPTIGATSIVPNPFTLQPNDFLSTAGSFGNDGGHSYDVSLSVPISALALANLINSITSLANNNPMYNLGSTNCTDFAILIFESCTNIDIPSSESPGPWSGQTPGRLGQIIRVMPPPVNSILNTFPQNAPVNNKN